MIGALTSLVNLSPDSDGHPTVVRRYTVTLPLDCRVRLTDPALFAA